MTQETAHWHEDAIRDLRETDMSTAEIGAKYGRSARTVQKLQFVHDIVRTMPNKRRGPKARGDSTALSRNHHAAGMKLNIFRGDEKVTVFAARFGWSPFVQMQMEVGQHNYKLTELIKLSTAMGLTIDELIRPYDKNIYQQPQRRVNGPS